MATLERSVLLPYSAPSVFELVNDVARYPEFVPGCDSVVVLDQGEDFIVARVHASARGMTEAFTTRNVLAPPKQIQLSLEEGPFRQLRGEWTFQPLGDAGVKVALRLDYQLGGTLARLLKPLMGRAADAVLEAFVRRAQEKL